MPVYNIPVLNKTAGETLVLDRQVLAYIFIGSITTWNDPRILLLQSASVAQKLHNISYEPIHIMVRDDDSSSTEVLTKSLDKFTDGEFTSDVGTPGSASTVWDTAVNPINIEKHQSASGLAAAVLLTEWSIGYCSLAEARLYNLSIPSFKQNIRQKNPIKASEHTCFVSLVVAT